ncbi:glycosyltransferase family 2 protein [Vibrio tritonius]|uniref:glycosyltransferase family 2 protein n=1 Tax=Vibrio tritonius TaxID=1435069 RepID=UPI0008396BE7|nr:glycosyltransferase family 2 protein [Vibrio tritonius]
MLISIITPSYNSVDFIEKTYESIRDQSYSDWEWVITDDCSTDGTFDFIRKLSLSDNRVRVFQNESNSGAAVSRNNSILNAKGEYIAFIDSDDLWSNNKLKKQLDFMESNNIKFCFTSFEVVDLNGNPLSKIVDREKLSPLSYGDMLKKKATLGCSTVMLRRDNFSDISMPLIRTGQDYGLWLKLLKTGELAYHLDIPLTRYRILPNSISRNKVKKAKRQWQIYREIEGLSLIKSFECFCFYAWRAVFRK